jgi:hypothetical protein
MSILKELLTEAEANEATVKITTLAQLTKLYNMKKLPGYHDAPSAKRYRAQTPKGQKLFDLEMSEDWEEGKNGKDKKYTKYEIWGGGKKMKQADFKSIKDVAEYLAKHDLAVEDIPLEDKQVAKRIGDDLAFSLKLTDFKKIGYIDWGNSIELQELDGDMGQLPYNQWMEGSHHTDDNHNLSYLHMDLKDFKAWHEKVGAKKKPKPKRSSSSSYYD